MSGLDTRTDLVDEVKAMVRDGRVKFTPLIDLIIKEAQAGEFHDYKNEKYVCGKIAANEMLQNAGMFELAERIRRGDFDETPDSEDHAALDKLMKEMVNGFPGR